MRSKNASDAYKSTVLPYRPDSCRNCWNKPKGSADDELAPRYHGIYVSLPVFLVESGGKTTLVCYRAECPFCGDVKYYDGLGCPYKLNGGRADFGVAYWPEIRRNGLDPDGFIRAVHTQKCRYFEAAKLPKYESGNHRAEFYEPKSERCDLYENV